MSTMRGRPQPPQRSGPLPLLINKLWTMGETVQQPMDRTTCPHCDWYQFIGRKPERIEVNMSGHRVPVHQAQPRDVKLEYPHARELMDCEHVACCYCGHQWSVERTGDARPAMFGNLNWMHIGRIHDTQFDNLRLTAHYLQTREHRENNRDWMADLYKRRPRWDREP